MATIPKAVGELEQRMMVFSKAFQDLINQVMKEKIEKEELRKELYEIKEELAKLQIEYKHNISRGKSVISKKKAKSAQAQQPSTRA